MIRLQAITPGALKEACPDITLQEARKIVGAVHRRDTLPASVKMVRRTALDSVRALGTLPRLTSGPVHKSSLDPFIKHVLFTPDGHTIETVRIPLEHAGRFSVCVSSQAGCGFACAFCATGQMGLGRNLEAWEMIEQVLTVRRGLDRGAGERVHGVVFQGMGEPLANIENVIQTIRVLCEPSGLAVDGRTITICTAGIPGGIRRLALEVSKVRLAISIGSARPDVRRRLMPIDRAYPLETVLEAAAEHSRLTGLAPLWAVTPLAGVNDTEEDAQALARHARLFLEKAGLRPQISIIPYNPVDTPGREGFSRSDERSEAAFRDILRAEGFCSRKRYSGGSDVRAACGQLAAPPAHRTSSPSSE
jgi:23S rRNA (adenine2503-C2)-methyltransferase